MWLDRRIIDLVGIDNPNSNSGTNDGPRRERVRMPDKLLTLTRFQCSKVQPFNLEDGQSGCKGSSAFGRALRIKRPPVRLHGGRGRDTH